MARRSLRVRAAAAVEAQLAQHTLGPQRAAEIRAKARSYARECGCAMSGAFLTAGSIAALCYFVATGRLEPVTAGLSLLLIVAAAALGKCLGVAIATARLALLRWSLSREPGVAHVDLH